MLEKIAIAVALAGVFISTVVQLNLLSKDQRKERGLIGLSWVLIVAGAALQFFG